jgi:drug/metabolite transporter (DMT)-like permease
VSAVALGLLLLAAGLHAGWNVLVKRAADRPATLWWALIIAGATLMPAFALAWPPPWEAVALSLASSVFEALYFLALVAAYGVGDLSLVYPVARGSAPLLIALGAVLLLGERPSLGGWAGIGLAVGGVVLVSAPGRAPVSHPGHGRPGLAVLLALATGLCISGYSLINKLGVAYLFAPAFTSLFHLGTALLLAPYVVRTRGRKLLDPWRGDPRNTAAIGLMVGGASTLVLAALAIERASYVGAVREVSVILGAVAGWLLLGEPLGQRRTLAAAVMFAGLALIAGLG